MTEWQTLWFSEVKDLILFLGWNMFFFCLSLKLLCALIQMKEKPQHLSVGIADCDSCCSLTVSALCAAADSWFLWGRGGFIYPWCGGARELWRAGWLQGCVPRLFRDGHVFPALLSDHDQSQEQPGPTSCAAQWVSQHPPIHPYIHPSNIHPLVMGVMLGLSK